MTSQQQNEAIAKWMGWVDIRPQTMWEGELVDNRGSSLHGTWPTTGVRAPIFDFVNDLNAMHEAETHLKSKGAGEWTFYLARLGLNHGLVDGRSHLLAWNFVHATAAQRAEALLRTLNLWTD